MGQDREIKRRKLIKRRVYEVLEVSAIGDPVARFIDRLIIAMILINVAAVVLETVPELAIPYGAIFVAIEVVAVVFFLIEYILRIWVANEHPPLRNRGRWQARIAYALEPHSIIDLMAILPSIIGFVLGYWDVNVLAIFRLLRFLKLARYSPGMRSLVAALASERRALLACLVIMLGLVLSVASVMHLLEAGAQPEAFGTIPSSMYWAVTTLTTVGYGDVVPITAAGRLLAGMTMIAGLAMFALPVGIIATAFAREIHARDFVVSWGLVARVPLFSELSAAEIVDVAKLLRAQHVEAGTRITVAGEEAHSMYFIATGAVEVLLHSGPLRLSDGQFFGEIAVLTSSKRSADVIALSDCKLLILDADDLHHLMARNRDIERHIRHVAQERIAHENITPHGDIVVEELGAAFLKHR